MGFASDKLRTVDFLFLNQQLTHLLRSSNEGVLAKEFYDVEHNIDKMKTTQLILLADYFKEKDLNSMSSFYEHDFKIAVKNEYEDVILDKEIGKNYIKIIWSLQHDAYMAVVINAENGFIVSRLGLGGIKLGKEYKFNDVIKAKHLKYLTNSMAQKVNNRYN